MVGLSSVVHVASMEQKIFKMEGKIKKFIVNAIFEGLLVGFNAGIIVLPRKKRPP